MSTVGFLGRFFNFFSFLGKALEKTTVPEALALPRKWTSILQRHKVAGKG